MLWRPEKSINQAVIAQNDFWQKEFG